jgi:hypothetical protein
MLLDMGKKTTMLTDELLALSVRCRVSIGGIPPGIGM